MTRTGTQSLQKLGRKGVLASVTALCLMLILTITVFAGSVSISDQAGVLDQNQVRSAANSLNYPLSVYTVNNFNGSTSSFDQRAANHVTNSNLIVISISTTLHHIAIKAGSGVPLSSNGASSAVNAFVSGYQGNGSSYTAGTVSSINSLASTLASSRGSSNNGSTSNANSGSGFLGIGGGCLIGLVILGLLFFFVLRRNRSGGGGGGLFNRPRYANRQQYVDPNYGQQYPPNYGPNYGPGYPNYPQNQGMNPLAAGGLGAAAGGLLGYELGKEQGERQGENQGYNQGDGGNFGGGNAGDFGGGASGDFGGGGGGDFGGGGGGDFGGGGGGDFGGGGGDSGGGGSGSF